MKQKYIKDNQAISVISIILSVLLVIGLTLVVTNFVFDRYNSMESNKPPNLYFTNVKASVDDVITSTVAGTDNISVNEIVVRYGINGDYPNNDADITSPTDYITGGSVLKADMTSPQANYGDKVWVMIIHEPTGTVVVDATDVLVTG